MKTHLTVIVAAIAAFTLSPAGAQTPATAPTVAPAAAPTAVPPASGATATPAPRPTAPIPTASSAPSPAGATAQPSTAPGAASPTAVAAPSAAGPSTTALAATPPPAGSPAAATPASYQSPLGPEAGVGQPDGRMGLQDQYSPIGHEAAWFHNVVLMPVISAISLFVLALLGWVILRYRRAVHPVPSRTTHNTFVEVAWTLIPVVLLVFIAVPSIRLLALQYSPPQADLTIKVIGNQWYWNYEYPDHGIELTSNMLPEQGQEQAGQRFRTAADGPRLLAVDERVVVPVDATVKLIVTSADVLHSFAMPAFWVKMDAVPGRLNETWFRADRPGVYFGQCSELCGARHGYMPAAIEVVSREDFARWVASRGGTMPNTMSGARPPGAPVSPDATQANTIGRAQAANPPESGGPVPTAPTQPAASNVVQAVETPATSRQGATNPSN